MAARLPPVNARPFCHRFARVLSLARRGCERPFGLLLVVQCPAARALDLNLYRLAFGQKLAAYAAPYVIQLHRRLPGWGSLGPPLERWEGPGRSSRHALRWRGRRGVRTTLPVALSLFSPLLQISITSTGNAGAGPSMTPSRRNTRSPICAAPRAWIRLPSGSSTTTPPALVWITSPTSRRVWGWSWRKRAKRLATAFHLDGLGEARQVGAEGDAAHQAAAGGAAVYELHQGVEVDHAGLGEHRQFEGLAELAAGVGEDGAGPLAGGFDGGDEGIHHHRRGQIAGGAGAGGLAEDALALAAHVHGVVGGLVHTFDGLAHHGRGGQLQARGGGGPVPGQHRIARRRLCRSTSWPHRRSG